MRVFAARLASHDNQSRSKTPGLLSWYSRITIARAFMIPILVIAFFLRTQELSTVGVSFDESFGQKMVEFSWGEIFYRMGLDVHPPLFYIVLKIWGALFGSSVIAGRLLSAILGCASVTGIYAFVRTAYRENGASQCRNFWEAELPAVIASALMAMAPLQIYWTLQIRMYPLTLALVAWSSFFLVRALNESKNRLLHWSVYTLSVSLLIHSHPYALFVMFAQYLYAGKYLWNSGQGTLFERLKPVAASVCCLWFSYQAWLPYFLDQRSRVNDEVHYFPKPTLAMVGTTMHELWVGMGVPLSATSGLLLLQGTILVLLSLAVGRRSFDILIVILTVFPVGAAIVISVVSQPIIYARYFMFSQVFVIAAVSLLVCRLPRIRLVLIPLLLAVSFLPCRAHYLWRSENAKLPGMRAAVAKIERDRNGQPVIVSNPMLYTSVLTYIKDRKHVYNFLPNQGFPFYQGTPVMRDNEYVDSEWLQATKADDLWILDAAESMGSVPLPPDWHLVGEEQFQEWFANLTVRLYVRNTSN